MMSGILDVNNVTRSLDVMTLQQAAELKNRSESEIGNEITINVVTGKIILSEYQDPTYFTSVFPMLFSYDISKHLDSR